MDIIHQDVPEKQCPTCEGFFPITTDYFHKCRQREHLDGLSIECRICNNERLRRNRANPDRKPRVKSPPGYKYCPECKETKPATSEYFRASRNELAHVCIICWKPYITRLAEAKKEKELAAGKKKCSACHKEFLPTSDYFPRDGVWLHPQCKTCRDVTVVAYRETHREEMCQSTKNWRENHLEHRQAYSKNYIRTHREQNRVYSHNRRAREKEVAGTHTPEQIQDQLERQKYRCYYAACGFSKFKKVKGEYVFTVEHTFPITRAAGMNIPANGMDYLVLSCKSCNSKKGNKLPHEWAAGGRLL